MAVYDEASHLETAFGRPEDKLHDPAIDECSANETWMPGTSPGMTAKLTTTAFRLQVSLTSEGPVLWRRPFLSSARGAD